MTGTDKDKIKTITRKEYEGLKRRALRFEPQNRNVILVIPCDGDKGWYEMGDNSALIYKYQVCEKLSTYVNLADDGDSFYTQFVLGRIRTRGVETVIRRVTKVEWIKFRQG